MPVAPPEMNAILPASLPGMVRSSFFSGTVGHSRTASGGIESGKRSGAHSPSRLWAEFQVSPRELA